MKVELGHAPISEPRHIKRDPIIEMQDRLRRIETRLTAWMEWSGFDTQRQRAVFNNGVIEIPSLDIRLKDLLDAIPTSLDHASYDEIAVVYKGQNILLFRTNYDN